MRPNAWMLGSGVVLTAAAVVVGVIVVSGAGHATQAAAPVTVQTVRVQQRTLTATVSEPGILTYRGQADGSPYGVINHAQGTYTQLPAAGQVIAQGHILYRVDSSPVVLLNGSTPAYRTLSVGLSGPDVAELNADLEALGYATRDQLTPRSTSFGSSTTTAVQKLQSALGMAQTGTLAPGQVVFEPTALRVTNVAAQVGGGAEPGATVLEGTSTARQVQLSVDTSQQTGLAVGDTVSITLPNNQTTPGVVSSVGAVATCPSNSGSSGSGSGSSSAASGADACSSSSTPTITVAVTPSHAAATGRWDQAPVQVGITTARVRNALVVPVTALLARANGGYAMEVSGTGSSATNRLVPVSLGVFDDADGLVAVTGSGLAAGQRVVVPSS